MRIAYLTGEYPRVTDTFIQREVAALRTHGATVETFSVRSPRLSQPVSSQQQQERERTTYLLPTNVLTLLLAHVHLLLGYPKQYIRAFALAWETRQPGIRGTLYQLIYFLEAGLLANQIRQKNITHLHNHFGDSSCSVAMLASALGGFDYSFTLHGPGIFFEPYRWRLDAKIRRAKFVSCISHFCRSQAMIFAPLETWSNLHIVHCGVDPQQFDPTVSTVTHLSQSKELRRSTTEPTVEPLPNAQRLLYVGRLAAAKGLPILLQSLSTLKRTYPHIRLTVVGDGADRAELEAQTQATGLTEQVDFVGYQAPAAVQQYLQATDVFVMSSFAEGVPVVLMEAMMAGRPVVATQIAGVSELVEEGVNGFLVPPSDVHTLTERIQTLLSDVALRQRFGEAGKLKVSQEFNINCEAMKLYQLIASETTVNPAEDSRFALVSQKAFEASGHDGASALSLHVTETMVASTPPHQPSFSQPLAK
ncbi:MAG: glycosyltransferase family 4 protein [Phormidesmis sp.]